MNHHLINFIIVFPNDFLVSFLYNCSPRLRQIITNSLYSNEKWPSLCHWSKAKRNQKLNCQLNLGQYLEINDAHYSLVASVCHLSTGLCLISDLSIICFQWFFKLFSSLEMMPWIVASVINFLNLITLFTSMMMTSLLVFLVYYPPPLDDAWLSKPEHHAHCFLLQRHFYGWRFWRSQVN